MSLQDLSYGYEEELREKRALKKIEFEPPNLIFKYPFEGKKYEETLVIRNISHKPVFVRVLQPSSSSIKMRSIKKGQFLSPGLNITLVIRYTVSMISLLGYCIIPVHVDDDIVNYHAEVLLAESFLSVEPEFVDFGLIDAGPTPSRRTIVLRNDGMQPVRYSIDLGSNLLHVVVDPIRGLIMENSSIQISVEMCLLEVGEVNTEFWVISQKLLRVKIKAVVVFGNIQSIHPLAMDSFTFIHFPPTYYGVKSIKSLLLKNNSQIASLFSVTGEYDRENVNIDVIQKSELDYQLYQVEPMEGRLHPNDRRPFTFTFKPKRDIINKKYALIVLKINKLYCKDLDPSCYSGNLFAIDSAEVDFKRGNKSDSSYKFKDENQSFTELGEELFDDLEDEDDEVNTLHFFESSIRIILFSTIEEPSVRVTPDEFKFENIEVNLTESRVLELTNLSYNLPILYRYKKIAFIEVKPTTGFLKSREIRQIEVFVTPKSYQIIDTNIIIELLYHDEPNINNQLKVIGQIKIPIYAHEKIVTKSKKPDGVPVKMFDFKKPNQRPKKQILQRLIADSALLALPNDRPNSLRPYRGSKMCKTIYAALPRVANVLDEEYQLTQSQLFLKQATKSYYQNYLRENGIRMRGNKVESTTFKGYDIDRKSVSCNLHSGLKMLKELTPDFIPLGPLQLQEIIIKPRNLMVDKLVPYSSFTNTIKIINNNPMAIRLYIQPHNVKSFSFPNGNRKVVKANTEEPLMYTCFTDKVGIRSYIIDIIVNESHVFETTLTIKVEPRILRVSCDDMTFAADDKPYKYFEVFNDYNTPISFFWEFVGDLIVTPMQGIVPARRSLTCLITCEYLKCNSNNYEMSLKMDKSKTKTVRVKIETPFIPVKFVNKINFGHTSVNVPTTQTAIMENFGPNSFEFETDSSELDGLTVTPTVGSLPPRGSIIFYFVMEGKYPEPIECNLFITVSKVKTFTVSIKANLRMPKLVFDPEILRFKKMSSSSFDIKCFSVKNNDVVPAMLTFDTDTTSEFQYSQHTNSNFITNEDVFYVEPDEEKVFSVFYYPFYPQVTSFYLPLMVNKFNLAEKNREKLNSKPIRIFSSVHSPKIYTKSWVYNFLHFPHYGIRCDRKQVVSLQNSSKATLIFCIRLDDMRQCFTFVHKSGGDIIKHDHSMVCTLQPNESINFDLTYVPDEPSKCEVKLPIYIKDDRIKEMHNFLLFKGNYPKPELIFERKTIYMGVVPTNFEIERTVQLTLKYHNPNCILKTFSEDMNIFVNFESNSMQLELTRMVQITYSSSIPHLLEANIEFKCSCGGLEYIRCTGGAENSMMSVHTCVKYFYYELNNSSIFGLSVGKTESRSSVGSFITRESVFERPAQRYSSTYPYFPTGEGVYVEYMEDVVKYVEKWIYEQGFYSQRYFIIPDTIAHYEVVSEKSRKSKIKKIFVTKLKVPLHSLLKNICGRTFNDTFSTEIHDGEDEAMCIFKLYTAILKMLSAFDTFLTHVSAKYLLTYDLYKQVHKKNIILSREDFYLRSKQCWLDVILQIYKIFILKKTIVARGGRDDNSGINFRDKKAVSTYSLSIQETCIVLSGNTTRNSNLLSMESGVLLDWFEKNIELQKGYFKSLLPYCDQLIMDEKTITCFDTDFKDGLPFYAAILTYCPYLKAHLSSMYIVPGSEQEQFHNACVLIKVLQLLKISFTLMPTDLYEPNVIHMIMFCTYLYDFLRHVKVKDTVQFSVNLCESVTEQITIVNDNEESIRYSIYFFGNDNDLFKVEETEIFIMPSNVYKLEITYYARFLKRESATIYLCGEILGSKFTHSQVFQLEGTPLLRETNLHLILHSPIYRVKKVEQTLQSPYEKEGEYELSLSTSFPEDVDSLVTIPYAMMYKSKTIARFYFSHYVFTADETGLITVNITVCSITCNTRIMWIIAKNPAIGDFIVELSIDTAPSRDHINITKSLSPMFKHSTCICPNGPDPNNSKCPRNIVVKIPSRNDRIWTAVMKYFMTKVDDQEKEFWKTYQYVATGMHVLKRVLDDYKKFVTSDMSYIFNSTMVYNVTAKQPAARVQRAITMQDMLSRSATTEVTIHLNSNVSLLQFSILSQDLKEQRNYKVRITYEGQTDFV